MSEAPVGTNQPQKLQTAEPQKLKSAEAPKINLGFSVDEDEVVNIVNERVRPYNRVEIHGNHDGTIEHVLRSQKSVANDVQKIIDIEQPVTRSLIYKRIADIYRLPRVTSKLESFVAPLLVDAWRDPASPVDNPTYWRRAEDAEGYIYYREGGDRDISDVPPIEIENAARYAVEEQISIPLDDLKRQTARMLGFGRNIAKVDLTIELAIANLIDKGILTEEQGAMTLAK